MQYKYVALSRDSFACLRLGELPIGAKTGVLNSLSDHDPDDAKWKRVVFFSVPQGAAIPGRHLRILTRAERDQTLPIPEGIRDDDVLIAVKKCASKKHQDNLPLAVRALHATLTGWRPIKKKRRRLGKEPWRRDCAIMG